jgi:tRNA G26 N,N-dimethylase Trm1
MKQKIQYFSTEMKYMFCSESELRSLIASITKEAQERKQNINIIPQFVGWNPLSFPYGNSGEYFTSIILMPR